jgi:hypothetical protein
VAPGTIGTVMGFFGPFIGTFSDRLPEMFPRFSARWGQGSVALSMCTAAHSLYARFTKKIGASISEAIMRPNPCAL